MGIDDYNPLNIVPAATAGVSNPLIGEWNLELGNTARHRILDRHIQEILDGAPQSVKNDIARCCQNPGKRKISSEYKKASVYIDISIDGFIARKINRRSP